MFFAMKTLRGVFYSNYLSENEDSTPLAYTSGNKYNYTIKIEFIKQSLFSVCV
jgi:hypothetical protein